MKAKLAIEQLKKEIERYRTSELLQQDLESRLLQLKESNETTEADYRKQVIDYEVQLTTSKQLLTSKEQSITELEERLTQTDIAYQQIYERYKESRNEFDELQGQHMKTLQQISELENEITHLKAHVDIYKQQFNDQSFDSTSLRVSFL